MSKIDDVTLGDIGRTVLRYRPYIAVVVAILLLVAFLPGEQDRTADVTAAGQGGGALGGAGQQGGTGDDQQSVDVSGGEEGATSGTLAGGGAGTTGGGGRTATGGGGTAGGGGGTAATGGGGGVAEGQMVANCDPNTGRIEIPSKFAPPCVPAFSGDNGGDTSKGVSGDTIKMAYYEVREDAATNAVLTAAGANDSDEEVRRQVRDWIQYYETHLEQYGRKTEVVFVEASGNATDDAAARADAIRVAEEIGAFVSINAANNTYVDEVVARGVMCMCAVSQPIELYLGWAPYVWSTLAASTQLYVHRAEYIGKRLAGKNAKWAGDPLMQQKQRRFGLLYYDTDDKVYKAGTDFFEQQLAKYGVKLAAKVEYHGYPNVARSQEEARPAIQKLVEAAVTDVICACDPFGPIFMTQEATRQAYQPEWVITGSALTDTSFFARLYDQRQWDNAFGLSALPARLPEEFSESYRLLKWHFGREPSAPSGYGIIRAPLDIFYLGVHLAGPVLTPETFRDGLWSMPINSGMVTQASFSFGRHGIWPWDDYLAFDDMTEIWWDPNAQGEDEIGRNGRGLYRYVDGGKRYLPTQWPTSDPKAFMTEGTITIYQEPPPSDRWPDYPPPKQ